jgi:hypothetical protein
MQLRVQTIKVFVIEKANMQKFQTHCKDSDHGERSIVEALISAIPESAERTLAPA